MEGDRDELLRQWRLTAREQLRRCGELRTRGDHEGFLNSSRKLIEALCKCLLLEHLEKVLEVTRHRVKDGKRSAEQLRAKILVAGELGIDLTSAIDTLSTARVIRRRVMATLHSVSLYGHEGSHARAGDEDAYAVVADQCAVGLRGLPRDLLLSTMYGADATDSLDVALSALRSDADRRAEDLAKEVARLRRRLDEYDVRAASSPAASQPSASSGGERSRAASPLIAAVILGLAGTGVGLAAGYWLGHRADPAPTPLPIDQVVAEVAAEPTPVAELDGSAQSVEVAAIEEVDAGTRLAAPIQCPSGTRRFEGGMLELSQPSDRASHGHRADWPEPRPRELAPTRVEPFCVDAREVSRDELHDWRQIEGSSACRAYVQPFHHPARCVTHEEAAAYCAERGGALPTIAQWELIARSQNRLQVAPSTREWVDDRFPPAVFNRRYSCRSDDQYDCAGRMNREQQLDTSGPSPRWSWNQPPAEDRLANLSFRCVVPPASF